MTGGNECSEAAKGLDENASSVRKCKSDTGYSSLSLDGALSLLPVFQSAGQTLTVPQIQLDLCSLNLSNAPLVNSAAADLRPAADYHKCTSRQAGLVGIRSLCTEKFRATWKGFKEL